MEWCELQRIQTAFKVPRLIVSLNTVGATDEVSAGKYSRSPAFCRNTDLDFSPILSGAIVHPAHLDDDEVFGKLKQPLYVSLAGKAMHFLR